MTTSPDRKASIVLPESSTDWPSAPDATSARLPAPASPAVPPYRLPLLGGLIVLALVGLLSATLVVSRNNYLHTAEVNTQNLSRLLQEQTQDVIHGVDAILSGFATIFAQIPPGKRPKAQDMSRLLAQKAGQSSYLRAVWILNTQGNKILGSDGFPAGASALGDRE